VLNPPHNPLFDGTPIDEKQTDTPGALRVFFPLCLLDDALFAEWVFGRRSSFVHLFTAVDSYCANPFSFRSFSLSPQNFEAVFLSHFLN